MDIVFSVVESVASSSPRFFIVTSFPKCMEIFTRIPAEENDIAPIAQALSVRRNSSGISRQVE